MSNDDLGSRLAGATLWRIRIPLQMLAWLAVAWLALACMRMAFDLVDGRSSAAALNTSAGAIR